MYCAVEAQGTLTTEKKNRFSHFSFLFPFPCETQGLILAAALSEYKKAVATHQNRFFLLVGPLNEC